MAHDHEQRSYKIAELLDSKFRIPHTNIRFGIDPLLGLVPGAGDYIGAVISLYFLVAAAIKGGKTSVLGRMFVNILLDLLIGSIPILGEAFDVYWKANIRNAEILKELEEQPEKTTSESRLWVWLVLIQFFIIIIAILLFFAWLFLEVLGLIF